MSEAGNNILRPAELDEVVPNTDYFMKSPVDEKKFYVMTLHPSTEWDNVVELVGAKRIYVRATKPTVVVTGEDTDSDSESSGDKAEGNMQLGMF